MKKSVAFIVFITIVAASVGAGIDSLIRAERSAQLDVDRALSLTLQRCESGRIDADTIRVYRSLIAMDAVRDTAYLSMTVSGEGERREARLQANTGLTAWDVWRLSDQRATGALAALAALWALASMLWLRRGQQQLEGLVFIGSLCFDTANHTFSVGRRNVHFTPMQGQLMELFFHAPDHRLTHEEICNQLWPRKPNANETLYSLIRRLKPLVEENGRLHIECERGRSYRLSEN